MDIVDEYGDDHDADGFYTVVLTWLCGTCGHYEQTVDTEEY